jgi:hypothetical protein
MPGSLTTPDRPGARNGASGRVAFRKMHCVGIQNRKLSRLNGWPMRPPVNASPRPSRAPAHDSGPMWIATPSSQGTCTLYSLPVSRRTQMFSGLPPEADLREPGASCASLIFRGPNASTLLIFPSRAAVTSVASSVPCSRPACRCDVSTPTSFVSSPAPAASWPRTIASMRD